jgi:hypothetical protein
MPGGVCHFEGIKRRSEFDVKMPKLLEDGTFDTTGATGDIHMFAESTGPGISYSRFTGQVDAVLSGVQTPIDANNILLRFVFVRPKSMNAGQMLMADMAVAELCRQVEADIPIWENKIYMESPTLCDGDGPIHQYRKWFSQFYADATPPPEKLRVIS